MENVGATGHEKLVAEYFDASIREFDTNPLAKVFLRRLARESPGMFFPLAMRLLRSRKFPDTHHVLSSLVIQQEVLLADYLAGPASCTIQVAQGLLEQFLAIDSSFDTKLAHRLPDRTNSNYATAFDGTRSTRILEILDRTSPGRRLLPIVTHLANSTDARVAAKATLFVGRRMMSPAWTEEMMSRPDQRLRANAVEALWGLNSPAAVQIFEKCLKDQNNRVVGNGLVGLHIAGHRSIESELLSLSQSGPPERRSVAAWVMGQVAQERWIETLMVMVKDANPKVKSAALRSLAKLRRSTAPESKAAKNAEAADDVKAAAIEKATEALKPDGGLSSSLETGGRW